MFVCRALLEARPNIGRLAHAALSGSSHVNLTSRFDPKLCPSSADVDQLTTTCANTALCILYHIILGSALKHTF